MKKYKAIQPFSTWDVGLVVAEKAGQVFVAPGDVTPEAARRLVTLNLLEEMPEKTAKTEEK